MRRLTTRRTAGCSDDPRTEEGPARLVPTGHPFGPGASSTHRDDIDRPAPPQDRHADVDGVTAEQDVGFAVSDLQAMQFHFLQEGRQDRPVEADLVPFRDEAQPDRRGQQAGQGSAGPCLG